MGDRPRIRVLDATLVDQIAAGEVVERPASVVKELVENALDAGAARLRVEIRDGGATLIAVSDDGCGMLPDEARLALQRHATSKLSHRDDLRRIGTFGFRGEALPAIASVARLRLRSQARGRSEGVEIRLDGGRVVDERAAAGREGTRIEVADLFAHVPARRKFLKTATTEWGHCADWLARAALALPAVHFDVQRDDRPAWAWPATADPLARVAAVLAEDVAAALVPVGLEAGPLRVHGFASGPDHHRGTAAGLYLYVNGRPVRDRLLRHAVLDVYRDVLPRGRFPSAVLQVEVPPEVVDVNVHPAKWEVRFEDPRGLHRLVTGALREALGQRRWLGGAPEPARAASARAPWAQRGAAGAPAPREAAGPGDWLFAGAAPGPRLPAAAGAGGATGVAEAPPAEAAFRFGDLRLLGQALATYFVVEGKDRLLLVDQHAAHERVLYEQLRATWLAGGVERQALLIPMTVELEAEAAAAIAEGRETALRLGFELEPFGEGAVVVRAVPALLADHDPVSLVRSLADELRGSDASLAATPSATRVLTPADRIFAGLACHAARRAGQVLSRPEQEALLAALDAIPWSPTCPHGRPVVVPLERAEIERRFGRR